MSRKLSLTDRSGMVFCVGAGLPYDAYLCSLDNHFDLMSILMSIKVFFSKWKRLNASLRPLESFETSVLLQKVFMIDQNVEDEKTVVLTDGS